MLSGAGVDSMNAVAATEINHSQDCNALNALILSPRELHPLHEPLEDVFSPHELSPHRHVPGTSAAAAALSPHELHPHHEPSEDVFLPHELSPHELSCVAWSPLLRMR